MKIKNRRPRDSGGPTASGPVGAHPKGRRPDERRSVSFGPQPRRQDHRGTDQRGSDRRHQLHQGGGGGDLVFGVEPVREIVAAMPQAIRALYVKAGAEGRFAAEIDAVRSHGASVIRAEDEVLRRMAGLEGRHQGIVAIVSEFSYASFEDAIADKPDPLLVVDGVTDPRNLGALLRSAEGAGVRTVVIARDRTCGLTPVAVKASAGAWVHLKIARCGNVARALEDLKAAGYWVAVLAPAGATPLYELDATRRLVLVAGSEGKGVREIVRKAADFVVSIPMHGRLDSLNVSVAAAVALFEISRRRALPA